LPVPFFLRAGEAAARPLPFRALKSTSPDALWERAQRFRNSAPSTARYLFVGFGALYLVLAVALGLRGALMGWLGLNLLLVGISYARQSAQLIGKQSDGSFHPLAFMVHTPFFAVAYFAFRIRRRKSEDAWNEVAPGIFVGRMLMAGEAPPPAALRVDLTCELAAPPQLRGENYRCLPTLDGLAPEPNAFRVLTQELAAAKGPVFIHCAAGHGRSATLAAAVMVARGVAADALAAEAMMRAQRPQIGLSEAQLKLVNETARL
jgi:hypothetical protein